MEEENQVIDLYDKCQEKSKCIKKNPVILRKHIVHVWIVSIIFWIFQSYFRQINYNLRLIQQYLGQIHFILFQPRSSSFNLVHPLSSYFIRFHIFSASSFSFSFIPFHNCSSFSIRFYPLVSMFWKMIWVISLPFEIEIAT